MKVRIQIQQIDETLQARDAAHLLSLVKGEAAKRAPFLLRGIIKSMSDLAFAEEAVRRDNAQSGRAAPSPRDAQEFLDWAVGRGYAQVLES